MFKHNKNKIIPFDSKVWLSSPTMHGEELEYMKKAYATNWMSTVGENINEVEKQIASRIGCKEAVALSSGTAALHLAIKLAGERIYGMQKLGKGVLQNKRVFCSDLTFSASVNPIIYEGGEPIFIDSEYESWNMDPQALRKAFELYPDVKIIVLAHLYGTPGKFNEIREIAREHGAVIIEDAAESLGAMYQGSETGMLGDYGCISFNGNKIITGSSGGMLLTNSKEEADKVRKWSTQSRENAPWYQHEELGYNYRMSNVIAGVVRGQIPHLEEHIDQKKKIYERYKQGLKDLPVKMNPIPEDCEANNWLSSLIIEKDAMCSELRNDFNYLYQPEAKKSCPMEILEVLQEANAEGRPIWKPMHLQPLYRMNPFINRFGNARAKTNAYLPENQTDDISTDIYERGVCLPSDNKMSEEEQDKIIQLIRECFE